jgi:6-phosphofructokinase 1
MKVFLSYHFADARFVQSIHYYLTKQSDLVPYFFGDDLKKKNWGPEQTNHWFEEVSTALSEANAFVLFLGHELGQTQLLETRAAVNSPNNLKIVMVKFPGAKVPANSSLCDGFEPVNVSALDEQSAQECAATLTAKLDRQWVPIDDIPNEYLFDYEKDIIAAYSKGTIDPKLIGKGCPPSWPITERKPAVDETSPLKEEHVGRFRDWDYDADDYRKEEPLVLAAALNDLAQSTTNRLCFPEAGPRKRLSYPVTPGSLTTGVLVSGGIAPGINAVIAGIVERQTMYAEYGRYEKALQINGYQNGFDAIYGRGRHYQSLSKADVQARANRGGSILGTSRLDKLMVADPLARRRALVKIVQKLDRDGIDILYVIGGDGSMRAAHAISRTARDEGTNISIVGIPKTMDNDVLWMWQSFGFLSAVQRSRDLIEELHTEAESNPRLCVIQLFGSDSGFVVTHAVSAIGVCDLFLIPEVPFTMEGVYRHIHATLSRRYKQSGTLETAHGMIVMAETAIPKDADKYFDVPEVGLTQKEKERIASFLQTGRVFGQTPDELRSGGSKLVSQVIQKFVKENKDGLFPERYWRDFRVFTNEPRHQIRATAPSSSDTIIAKRLGTLAVDGAMAGYDDFMISQWLTEYVMVPLRLVVLGRKRIPQYGVFYKSARASTGQPADLI